MKCLNFWLCLLITLLFCCLTTVIEANVCSRIVPVSDMVVVTKLVTVTYRKRTFLIWHNAQKNEIHSVPEIRYRYETQYFCCDGYEGSTDDCKPVCYGCVPHSHCAAPYQCKCDAGYEGPDCRPSCDACGKNSNCVAPGMCVCHDGYRMNDNDIDCVPSCFPSCGDNSFCSAPNTCECEVGYERSSPDAPCLPVCSPSCPEDSICKQPNHCECYPGYELSADIGMCVPICGNAGCGTHSSCVAPGECQCDQGYSWNNSSCQAICTQACPEHSSCQQPDQCICDEGYVQNNQNLCEPQCPRGCDDYARCVAPDVCECYEGYEYPAWEKKCRPNCSQGCPNGYCFGPEVCACNPGYLMGPNNSCEPQCTPSCIHGNCSAPGTCVCEPGYRFASDSQHKCEPICEPECENGDCLAPQTCICHLGYEPEVKNGTQHVCKPSCSRGCKNGNCIESEVCQCSAGFVLVEDECVVDMRLTTDVVATSAMPAELLQLPITSCTDNCSCWQELSDLDIDDDAIKCVNICMDDYDQPCLELHQCHCNSQSSLICGIEQLQQRFICKIFKQLSATNNDNPKAKDEAALNSSKTAPSAAKWPAILAWCSGLCLLVIVLTIVTHFYLKHQRQKAFARQAEAVGIMSFEKDA